METDDKIKQGIRCCQTQYNKNCVDCPYQKYKSSAISTMTCSSELRKDILDLVNRQEARFNFLKDANELQKKYRKIEIMSKKSEFNSSITLYKKPPSNAICCSLC